MNRRVVVSGIGIVCPFGLGKDHSWKLLVNGEKVAQSVAMDPDYASIPSKVVCRVPDGMGKNQFNLIEHIDKSEQRTMSRASVFALVAAQEALEDAQISKEYLKLRFDQEYGAKKRQNCPENAGRVGVAVGCGMVDLADVSAAGALVASGQVRKVSPYFMPRILTNMPAGLISIKHGLGGVNHSVATACATGLHSIGDAMNFIKLGHSDVMLCGATEACINPVSLAGFSRLRALSTKFTDFPERSSRPFDAERDGFVMGEGAAILVLESLDKAMERGMTNFYCEIVGYGLSSDACHMTSPDAKGHGAYLAMKRALENCDVQSQDVGYINAHATSTPLGDKVESMAIRKLIGNRNSPPVSSFKGAFGHLLGAAGAIELAFTAMACKEGIIPPTANLSSTDIDFDLDYVQEKSRTWTSCNRSALCNSFGFGGTNVSLVIKYPVLCEGSTRIKC